MSYCPIHIEMIPQGFAIPVQTKKQGKVAIQVQSAPSLSHCERILHPFWLPVPVTDELAEYN